MRGIGADELEAQCAHAAAPGPLDGVELRAGHPDGRMRLLQRLGHHVAERDVEVLAVMLRAALPEHREDRRHGLVEHVALVLHGAAERLELGDGGALAHAELAASVAQEIEHGDALGNARGVIGGELQDAVAEADAPGALAGGGEKRLRRGAVRVLLEEVVLHHPRVVVADPVGQLDLRQGIPIELVLPILGPGPRQLQLIEDAELHVSLPQRIAQCGHDIGPRGFSHRKILAAVHEQRPFSDKVRYWTSRRFSPILD